MNYSTTTFLPVAFLLLAVVITAGCTNPQATPSAPAGGNAPAATGDTVLVHYTGTLDNGEVFDSSSGREPLRFTLGAGSMIPEFEQAIIGMNRGEEKTFTILSDNAYGPKTLELKKDSISVQEELQVGQQLRMVTEEGRVMEGTVTAVGDDMAIVTNTHPLAGENLTFAVHLVEIEEGD
jgi:peptidylprolyl isomerase